MLVELDLKTIDKSEVKGLQCMHAVMCYPPKGMSDDYHLVKERVHLKDGRTVANVRLLKNWKRSFWVTKKGARNHKQKKERELISRLDRFESTESQLARKAAAALDMPWFNGTMYDLSSSPYLYGTDILSTALIKGMYREKFPDCFAPSSVAAFDTETSMEDGTIIIATLSFKDRIFTAIRKDYLEGWGNVETRLQEAFDKYLGKYKDSRNIKWETMIVNTEADIVVECFKRAHQWKPDFVAIWNINFDMPKMLAALEKQGIHPKDVFSDPILPKQYRHFRYKEGKKIRVMASGKTMPIGFADQWHVVFCPSSFYFIDSMCVYRKSRVAKGELPEYSLDFVLNKELGERKLRFKEADEYSGAEWHEVMQSNFKIEYVIYNVFDCLGMELLDEKILDLAIDLPISCQYSDYRSFESQPKRVVDEMHYFLQEEFDSIIGSTGGDMLTEDDKLVPPNTDLIVNLAAYLIEDNGLKCIEENPNMHTSYRTHNYDSDVSAAYPSNTEVFNLGRETCKRLMCRIEGKSEYEMRMSGINLSGGHTNSLELCQSMFGLPNLPDLLKHYESTK